jgi:hypothetical protein
VPYGFGPRLPAEVGSSAATCPMAPDLTSRLMWAPMLSRVLCLRTSPIGWGGLQRCHVSHGSLRATRFKYKEKPSRPAYTARHAYFQCTRGHFQGSSHQGYYASARRAGKQCSQCLQGVRTSIYSAVTVRRQHYRPPT